MPLQLRREFLEKKVKEERAAIASKLYFDERLSMREIATRMNIATTTVDRALRTIPGFAALKKRSRITDEIKASAVELYAQGYSAVSIAEHLGGLSAQTITNIVRQNKPELLSKRVKTRARNKARVTPAQKDLINKLYSEGLPYKEIAAKAGVGVSNVGNLVKYNGDTIKRKQNQVPANVAAAIKVTAINPDDIRGTVVDMYRSDYMTVEDIAGKLSLPKAQVENIVREYRYSLKG